MIDHRPGICPVCALPLEVKVVGTNSYWMCAQCLGTGAHSRVLCVVLEPSFVVKMVAAARQGTSGKRSCPLCRKIMNRFSAYYPTKSEELDYCMDCDLTWFDAGRFEKAPILKELEDPFLHAKKILKTWDEMNDLQNMITDPLGFLLKSASF